MNVARLVAFLRDVLAEEHADAYGEPWWDYHSGDEPIYRREPMVEEQEKVAALRRIVDHCEEMIGDRDLSRYGQFGCLREDPQSMAVTLAVETLLDLAWGFRIDNVKPTGLRDGYDVTWAPEDES